MSTQEGEIEIVRTWLSIRRANFIPIEPEKNKNDDIKPAATTNQTLCLYQDDFVGMYGERINQCWWRICFKQSWKHQKFVRHSSHQSSENYLGVWAPCVYPRCHLFLATFFVICCPYGDQACLPTLRNHSPMENTTYCLSGVSVNLTCT